MTLNKLQENLTKKGYTSEEVDVWTAGYVYALNHQPDLKPLVAENEALKEQVDGLKNAINSALRESADIREGIRTGQARDLVIIDNSFYVIEDGLQIALATHGGNDE